MGVGFMMGWAEVTVWDLCQSHKLIGLNKNNDRNNSMNNFKYYNYNMSRINEGMGKREPLSEP